MGVGVGGAWRLRRQSIRTFSFGRINRTGLCNILCGTGVRVAIGATGDDAAFSVGADTIVVDNRRDGTSSYDVALPAVAQVPSVTIRIGDMVVFARTRGQITTGVAADATGGYTIPLADDSTASPR